MLKVKKIVETFLLTTLGPFSMFVIIATLFFGRKAIPTLRTPKNSHPFTKSISSEQSTVDRTVLNGIFCY